MFYVDIIYFDTCKHLIQKYTLTVIFNHELNMTIMTFIYLFSFTYLQMGETRTEIQKDYRARKKLKFGRKYLDKEYNRVKQYYVPAAELTKSQLKI